MFPKVKKIKEVVADAFDVDVRQIEGRRQDQSIVRARHAAMFLAKNLTQKSYPELGYYFKRDHSTIVNAVQMCEHRMCLDGSYQDAVNLCREKLLKPIIDEQPAL